MTTTLASQKLFYTHAWETYLIGGLLIFLLGFIVGWRVWRGCRANAKRIEALNDALRENKAVLAENNSKLSKIIDDLSNEPQS